MDFRFLTGTLFLWIEITYTPFIFFMDAFVLGKIFRFPWVIFTILVISFGNRCRISRSNLLRLTSFRAWYCTPRSINLLHLNYVVLSFFSGVTHQTPPKCGYLVFCRECLLFDLLLLFFRLVNFGSLKEAVYDLNDPFTVFKASSSFIFNGLATQKLELSPFLSNFCWSSSSIVLTELS